jgi:hypothetical protein
MLERNTPFYGWGHTGELESTALAVRALASGGDEATADRPLLRQGLLFLLRNEDKDGMWYHRQTTVHVLKTLLSMVEAHERSDKLTLRVNGKDAKVVELSSAETVVAPIEVDLREFITKGENQVNLESANKGMMSVQFVANLYVPWGDVASVTSKQEPQCDQPAALHGGILKDKGDDCGEHRVSCSSGTPRVPGIRHDAGRSRLAARRRRGS